jgi:hypothetical protein
MVVKLPLYNKIRSLKRRLTTSQTKLQKAEKQLKRFKKHADHSKYKCSKGNRKPTAGGSGQAKGSYKGKGKAKGMGKDKGKRKLNTKGNSTRKQPMRPASPPLPRLPIVEIPQDMTPKKAAEQLMEKSNLSPLQYPELHKDMTSYATLVQQIAKAPKKMKMSIMEKQKVDKKSRVASYLARKIGLSRKSVLTKRRKNIERRLAYVNQKSLVVDFLKKPQNSSMLPGKRDCTIKGLQRYTLSDTMSNLFTKFQEEYPECKLSFATFCRQRPAYMKLIQWAQRRQCLCVYHENTSLKLKALKKSCSVNKFLQDNTQDGIKQMLEDLPDSTVYFKEWQKEEIPYEGNIMKKLRLKTVDMSKSDFIEKFLDECCDMRQHIYRVNTQFTELDHLKKNLQPFTEATCQLDYSENFPCVYQDEPSAAFYDRRQVTLMPMVIHFKDQDSNLRHKSFVGITSERTHSAPTTFAFLRQLLPKVKELLPSLHRINYISDSPVSQFRNKSIVNIIAKHEEYFNGVDATWSFLECGHGKGACDGVGGSLKKSAEISVKAGDVISSAEDFFDWAVNRATDTITPIYATAGDIYTATRMLKNSANVKGMTKCHIIRPFQGKIYIRETSCLKDCCATSPVCEGWIQTNVGVSHAVSQEKEAAVQEEEETTDENYEVGLIVEVQYGKKTYRGEIIEHDAETHEYHIKFMKQMRDGRYIWSKSSTWYGWLPCRDIVKVIQ